VLRAVRFGACVRRADDDGQPGAVLPLVVGDDRRRARRHRIRWGSAGSASLLSVVTLRASVGGRIRGRAALR
jgi:hypothetical protein